MARMKDLELYGHEQDRLFEDEPTPEGWTASPLANLDWTVPKEVMDQIMDKHFGKRKCKCELQLLLSSGCKCGGV
jgi:hypothetical protein